MNTTSYKETQVAACTAEPTCTHCGAQDFTHKDQEFGGEMTRIIFCFGCGGVIGVVVAI